MNHAALILAFVAGAAALAAQERPSLDVVSIREDRLVAQFIPKNARFYPGRMNIAHWTVEDLVAFANGPMSATPRVRANLIVGWPASGIKNARFHIAATLLNATDPLSLSERQGLVIDVLNQRFGFKAHTEIRPVDVYRLVLVKPGVFGPGFRRVSYDCADLSPAEAPKDEKGRSMCGTGELSAGVTFIRRAGDMARLAILLNAAIPDRLVVDGTGLEGFFVLDATYGRQIGSLETVLPTQTGLKLEPTRIPLKVTVIDDVRMPTPN